MFNQTVSGNSGIIKLKTNFADCEIDLKEIISKIQNIYKLGYLHQKACL